jgi:hypothetical protein
VQLIEEQQKEAAAETGEMEAEKMPPLQAIPEVVDNRPHRLSTIPEACEYARFSRTKLYMKLNENIVRAYKRGSKTLIDLNSIDGMSATLSLFVPRGKIARG